ncbi:uncharacterized protein LOC126810065 [Patella vulgata]|uniref:uncharacterized protein LOC126810065 n=1 Tax=Patella vulgata TaxID=6465 RepID=UPI00217F579E|nr:uncharacterized protein LOC126810065 [Patella vulgata]XP_050390976.1 uncharacterized protein LOC126810065 [Patella vulgata]
MVRFIESRNLRKFICMGLLVMVLILINLLLIYDRSTKYKVPEVIKFTQSSPLSQNDKWIVVTTSSFREHDITALTRIPGWKVVVVVLRRDAIPAKRLNNCVYLDIDQQNQLGYKTADLIPEGSYARKNIGYLYAISHGAKMIYETDDNVRLLDGLQRFRFKSMMTGLVYAGENMFNPYRHFGQPTLWPRGYPLSSIGEEIKNEYILHEFKTPLIQQGLISNDPDVDAVLKLSRKTTKAHFNATFDSRAPPVILPAGVFSPFNSKDTLFLYNALWALMLPTTVKNSEPDIWRGYWVQRLLWEIDGNLGFFPPNAVHTDSEHSTLDEAVVDAKRVYFQTEDVITFLRQWRCPADFIFYDCIMRLSREIVEHDFWENSDYDLAKSWLNDLRAAGFVLPKRRSPKRNSHNMQSLFQNISSSKSALSINTKDPKVVYFWPSEQNPPSLYSSAAIETNGMSWNHMDRVVKMCSDAQVAISHDMLKTHKQYEDILLIIAFNNPHLQNILHLQTLYSIHFSHILFCANDSRPFVAVSKNLTQRVSFVKTFTHHGIVIYNCLSHAIAMNYDVSGYILMGDDVLLNSWNIGDLPRDKFWFQRTVSVFNKSSSYKENRWAWWKDSSGKPAYNNFSNFLQTIPSLDPEKAPIIHDFNKMLISNTKSDVGLLRAVADFLYVPKRFQDRVLYFLEIFSKYGVMLELAIPTVIGGLDHRKNIVPIRGVVLWFKKRLNYTSRFEPSGHFMHPVKLGIEMKTEKGRRFICSRVIPLMLQGVLKKKN